VIRPETRRVLFREGTAVKAQVAMNFQGLVPGSAEGPVHVFAGSANASIMQALPNELRPVWIPGDRAARPASSVLSFASKDPSGTMYFSLGNAIARVRANRLEPVLNFPLQFPIQQAGE
jgi:hypothetical protein